MVHPPSHHKMVPITKKEAVANPTAAQELIGNLSSLIPTTDITIFTDGSVTRNPNARKENPQVLGVLFQAQAYSQPNSKVSFKPF